MSEFKKREIFLEALRDLKRHFRPTKQILLIYSFIFSVAYLLSAIRIAITNQGILFYLEINGLFSCIVGMSTILFLIILDTIRELRFTYNSSRLNLIKQRIRERKRGEISEDE